jgi:3-hydroxyisobutyrate dehydrogenase-like beta-hydroxyacid dehydrogenase
MAANEKAAFIGLGSMGAPIARRLARSGYSVVACDVSPAALQAFDEPDTTREPDPLYAARQAKLLGICVRTDEQLEQLVNGGALFAAMGAGGLVILHSTVAPELARRLASLATQSGVDLIDVGVSGGGPAAIEGKLSLFVGGEETAVERARPWLQSIGKSVAYLGPIGHGLEGKILNNLISIANYGMSAAIVDVGAKLGFDIEKLTDALMAGSAQSFALKISPGWIKKSATNTPARLLDLHDLLKKDVDHARNLLPAGDPAMTALLASCEAMLARLTIAAAQAAQGVA